MYDPNLPPPPPGMMQTLGGVPQQGAPMPGFKMPEGRPAFGRNVGWTDSLFGNGNAQQYLGQLKAWLAQRPADMSGFDAWRAAMPSPFGAAAPQPPALPPGQQAPYPVTQVPNQPPVTQIAPVPPQAPVTAPPFPAPPASGMAPGQMPPQGAFGGGYASGNYAPGNYAPRQGNPGWAPNISRPVNNPGGGFFGSRRGR